MDDIMKIVICQEESGLLLKGVNKKIKNEATAQKGNFLSILLGILGANFNKLLTSKAVKARIPEQGVIKPGGRTISSSFD